MIVYLISEIEAPPKPTNTNEESSLDMVLVNYPSEIDLLKTRLEEALSQNEELRHNYDQMDKLVHDRDRESRGLRKQIEHFE